MRKSITYERFLEIAREEKAYSILETWDKYNFEMYIAEFGGMTVGAARNLCKVSKNNDKEIDFINNWNNC